MENKRNIDNDKVMEKVAKYNISSLIFHDEESTLEVNSNTSQRVTNKSLLKQCWFKTMGDIYAKDDPHDLSNTRKNAIVLIIALIAIIGSASIFIYIPGSSSVMSDMNTSLIGLNATVAIYSVLLGIAVSFLHHLNVIKRKILFL